MSGTVANPIGITNPPIDALVIYSAKRARQINAYYSQLQEGLLEHVGPLVDSQVHEKPMSIALRRCPRAVVLPVDRAAYQAVSADVMGILAEVSPVVESLSLDEAFLDVSSARRRLGRPADIARMIRARVAGDLGLTCSVGIAPTKFVAKVASARCKPDGMLVVPADGVLEFLHPLPITALWGVGPSTAERLHRLGLRTVADVAQTPVAVLSRAVGAGAAAHLSALAAGQDPRRVHQEEVEKSISSDRTFDTDLVQEGAIRRELLRLSEDVTGRLRHRGFVARTVGIKVRFADFRTLSRTRTLGDPTDSTAAVHEVVVDLYRGLQLDQPRVRLLGVKAEGLIAAAGATRQLSFDDLQQPAGGDAPTEVSALTDQARHRFGPGTLAPASLLGRAAP